MTIQTTIQEDKGYTGEKWIGDKNQEVKKEQLSTVEIAKRIRQDVKDYARKHCPNLKTSITSQYFSMGSSIHIYIKECGFNPMNPLFNANNYESNENIYTEQAYELIKELKAIGNAYNYSDCDGMIDYFDVRFWFDVTFDYESIEKWRNKAKEVLM